MPDPAPVTIDISIVISFYLNERSDLGPALCYNQIGRAAFGLGFAGDDIEAAVLYPEDERYLIGGGSAVAHYEVVDEVVT